MRFKRRRSARPDSARSGLGSGLEVLEGRQLLSRDFYGLFAQYAPGDLSVTNPITHRPVPYSVDHQVLNATGPNDPLFSNQGKIVSGKNRAGDEWTITVHGPGYVIVTDTSPNDGVLSDEIDTIQVVGSNIDSTYVTGNVDGSFRTQTSGTIGTIEGTYRVPPTGTILFNRLIATSGVKNITLNGFTLTQTVVPAEGLPNNTNTGIYLTGGVRHLQFHDLDAPIDTSTDDAPVNIVIGDPSTPLKVEPTIVLDHIFNTVFDSTDTDPPPNVAQIDPTVNIIVNGQIRGLDIFSTTQAAIPAGETTFYPVVGTTGRTSVQAMSMGHLLVRGKANNLTASRDPQPFQNGFSGMQRIGRATFKGETDAVGLDVNGEIGSISYARGMGNPAGVFVGQTAGGQAVPASRYGIPSDVYGYPGIGYLGGLVTASRIGHVNIGPANVATATPTNPDFGMLFRQGTTTTIARPGTAMVNSAITTTGGIGQTTIVGDQVNSEIKTGFHYPSYAAGLEGTRAPSRIGRIHQSGDMLNGVTSATVRPAQNIYGAPGTVKGPGSLRGQFNGRTYATGGTTALGNVGAGFFARSKAGYLPPLQQPLRNHTGRIVH